MKFNLFFLLNLAGFAVANATGGNASDKTQASTKNQKPPAADKKIEAADLRKTDFAVAIANGGNASDKTQASAKPPTANKKIEAADVKKTGRKVETAAPRKVKISDGKKKKATKKRFKKYSKKRFNNAKMVESLSVLANRLVRRANDLFNPVTKQGNYEVLIHINYRLARLLQKTSKSLRDRASKLCSIYNTRLAYKNRKLMGAKCTKARRPKDLAKAAKFINDGYKEVTTAIKLLKNGAQILKEEDHLVEARDFKKDAKKCAKGLTSYKKLCTATGLKWKKGKCVVPKRFKKWSKRAKKWSKKNKKNWKKTKKRNQKLRHH